MKNITIIICLLFSVSCTDKNKRNELKVWETAIQNIEVNDEIKNVVVLPGLGCQGCIQVAEQFMKKNINNPKILFVLTNLSSLKIFQQKTEITIKEHDNIYLDKSDLFSIVSKNHAYPCVIYLDDGKVKSFEYQNSKCNAFAKLKKKLKNDH